MNIISLLIKVITSWQVIVISIALLLYIKIVTYVGQPYHRPKARALGLEPETKGKQEKPSEAVPKASDDDDLGLEEESV